MSSGKQKHILVAVLDWGLGHATRCIPVINCLLANHCNVSVAGNGPSLELLKQEFPKLIFHELPSYKITYPSHGFFFSHLLFQSPGIFSAIRKERKAIEKLIGENQIDSIISDNRYGCYSRQVPSVLMTHQLNMQLPTSLNWSVWLVNKMNHRLINKFDECWIPDNPDSRLTGKLTETKNLNVRFIGILSRFTSSELISRNDLLVGLISGPEPQREIFEKLLIQEFKILNRPCLLVRGLPQVDKEKVVIDNITLINHASTLDLQKIISEAEIIVSRSGYSTIMDLLTLHKKRIIFIPTPGQPEQEYLAYQLERKKIAFTQSQDEMDLKEAIERSRSYRGFDAEEHTTNLLNEAIKTLLQ